MVRMRSPVRIRVAAPDTPEVHPRGFGFLWSFQLPSMFALWGCRELLLRMRDGRSPPLILLKCHISALLYFFPNSFQYPTGEHPVRNIRPPTESGRISGCGCIASALCTLCLFHTLSFLQFNEIFTQVNIRVRMLRIRSLYTVPLPILSFLKLSSVLPWQV